MCLHRPISTVQERWDLARGTQKKRQSERPKKGRNTPSERTIEEGKEERLQIECSEFIDVSLRPPLKSRGEGGVNTNCGAQTTTTKKATRPRWPPTTSYENGPPLPWAKRKEGREGGEKARSRRSGRRRRRGRRRKWSKKSFGLELAEGERKGELRRLLARCSLPSFLPSFLSSGRILMN